MRLIRIENEDGIGAGRSSIGGYVMTLKGLRVPRGLRYDHHEYEHWFTASGYREIGRSVARAMKDYGEGTKIRRMTLCPLLTPISFEDEHQVVIHHIDRCRFCVKKERRLDVWEDGLNALVALTRITAS